MHVNVKRGFYYHADANAFGGRLTQPLPRVITTQSSVSLAQAGGFGNARAKRYDLDGLVSFEAAQATVSGIESHDDAGWRSVATASIEGLNILHVITADRLVAQLSVTHFREESRLPEISFNGTQFVNLRLNGQLLDLNLNRELFTRSPNIDCPRSVESEDATKSNESVLPRFCDLIHHAKCQYRHGLATQGRATALPPRFVVKEPQANLDARGFAVCSLVNDVPVHPPATSFGHVIHVPDFGNIFLGEMRVTPYSVQLTMLRVELGCIAHGDLSAATAFSNGSTMP